MDNNFTKRKCIAGALEPGDATRYEMVVVEMWDTYEVVVLNDGFFDKITFLKHNWIDRNELYPFYHSHRGDSTNPWTIKAARKMIDLLLAGGN